MRISETDILLVPGLGNSGPGHWQRRWLEKMPNAQWIEQDNWDRPDRESWLANIERAILMATRPVVLVGHALGAVAIVHTAHRLTDTKVRGAFLVAVPDIEDNPNVPAQTAPFAPLPRNPLPFPSMTIAAATDPYCTLERAADLANAWGSDFHEAGEAGHINTESGHGPWPDGMMMFARFMQRLKS